MEDVLTYVSLVKDRGINVLVQHTVAWPSLQMEKLVKVLQLGDNHIQNYH